jgi:(S)-2-hydroxyglutarate dehydrogenase
MERAKGAIEGCDFLIIGAGIVGITIALELKRRHPAAAIVVLEKETGLGKHSSGRNSGVIHSGIYYPPASLKAKVCSQGAREMIAFHERHGLRIRRSGKVLVAARKEDDPQIDVLLKRAGENGIVAELVDEQSLREIEPEARSATGRAIYVHVTAVGDPAGTLRVLQEEMVAAGILLRMGEPIAGANDSRRVVTLADGKQLSYGHAINTAGLHADTVARFFGVGHRYVLLPFKGLYWKLDPDSGIQFRRLIYPVPDLRVPFLGVHTTTTVDGTAYFGPTAVPAFGREQYRGLEGLSVAETSRILTTLARQFVYNRDGFRRLAWQEGRRYFKHWFAEAAQAIVPRVREEHLLPTDKVGIRAQMFDRKEGRLVNDFLVEQSEHSTHVLNAISPAWTGAFPFARYLCDQHIPTS